MIRTLRLPAARIKEASESPLLKAAGITFSAPLTTAFGDTTEWKSVQVTFPAHFGNLTDAFLVGRIAAVCISERETCSACALPRAPGNLFDGVCGSCLGL
jgi:hypothetical protein